MELPTIVKAAMAHFIQELLIVPPSQAAVFSNATSLPPLRQASDLYFDKPWICRWLYG
jgi:hypothetical protein